MLVHERLDVQKTDLGVARTILLRGQLVRVSLDESVDLVTVGAGSLATDMSLTFLLPKGVDVDMSVARFTPPHDLAQLLPEMTREAVLVLEPAKADVAFVLAAEVPIDPLLPMVDLILAAVA